MLHLWNSLFDWQFLRNIYRVEIEGFKTQINKQKAIASLLAISTLVILRIVATVVQGKCGK